MEEGCQGLSRAERAASLGEVAVPNTTTRTVAVAGAEVGVGEARPH